MEEQKYCQSCGMPMTDEILGTEKDGSDSEDYCKFCYENGEFLQDFTMAEMIEFCIPLVVANSDMDEQSVSVMLNKFIPQLKRWKNE